MTIKKKISAVLLSVILVLTMIPAQAFATPAGDAATHIITFNIFEGTSEMAGDGVYVRVDLNYSTESELMKSLMVYLKYDASVLTPVFASGTNKGQSAVSYLAGNTFNKVTENMTANNFQPGAENESETILYEKIDGDFGYMCWKVSDLRAKAVRSALATSTRMSSVYFKLNTSKYADFSAFKTAVNKSGQRLLFVMNSDAQANAAGLNASCTCQIVATDISGNNVIYYYGASTLTGKAALKKSNFRGVATSGALGDVNLDGSVNSTDLQRLYSHLEGVTPLLDPTIGDINQDGLTNSTDLQRLYSHLEGVTPLQD